MTEPLADGLPRIPEHAMALMRRHLQRADNPADQAFMDLRGRALPSSLLEFLQLDAVRTLATVVHASDNAACAAVVRSDKGALLVSAGLRPLAGEPTYVATSRKAGIRWTPAVALLDDVPGALWMPCPKCQESALGVTADRLRAEVKQALSTRHRRVVVSSRHMLS